MATYEVYLGGTRKQNDGFAMFPSATFAADGVIQPAVRQRPVAVFPARNLDFANETALVKFIAANPLASGDKLGALIIPANFYALGFYWRVATINTGGSFSAATRIGGTSLVGTTTTGTANSAFIAWTGGATLFKTSDIVDVTFPTVPAGGMGSLDLQIGVVGYDLRIGDW